LKSLKSLKANLGMRKISTLLAALVLASSCASVTIRKDIRKEPDNDPAYSSSKPFMFWGLVGSHHVNVASICGNRNVVQMQSEASWSDVLFTVVTAGIYSPRTAYVWCEK